MNDQRGVWIPFLAGAATGAALAMVFSPKSGPELRKSIGTGLDELKHRASDAVGQGLERAGYGIASAGKSVEQLAARMQQ